MYQAPEESAFGNTNYSYEGSPGYRREAAFDEAYDYNDSGFGDEQGYRAGYDRNRDRFRDHERDDRRGRDETDYRDRERERDRYLFSMLVYLLICSVFILLTKYF